MTVHYKIENGTIDLLLQPWINLALTDYWKLGSHAVQLSTHALL